MILNDAAIISGTKLDQTILKDFYSIFFLWLIIFSLFCTIDFSTSRSQFHIFALIRREIADYESYLSNRVAKDKFLFTYITMMEIQSFKCTYLILREIYYIRNIKKYLFKFKTNNYFNYWYFKWWNIEEKSFVSDRRPFDSIIDWKLIGIMKHAKQYSFLVFQLYITSFTRMIKGFHQLKSLEILKILSVAKELLYCYSFLCVE